MKKFLAVFLCFALLLASGVVTNYDAFEKVSAAGVFTNAGSNAISLTSNGVKHDAELKVWDGKAGTTAPETTVIDGETFYMIEDGSDLAWFANKVNTGNSSSDSTNRESNAILVNDIDLGGHNWYSFRIGQSWYFAGTFDGAGHTIHNLYIESSTGGGGFIGTMGISGKAATLKNIKFENARSVSTYTGDWKNNVTEMMSIACGYMTSVDSLIENVSVSGKITVKSSSHSVIGAGSIVGQAKRGTIRNCFSDAVIDLSSARNIRTSYIDGGGNNYGVGGIIGVFDPSPADGTTTKELILTRCGFEGTINAPQNSRVGGVVGMIGAYRYWEVSRCYSIADITGFRQVAGVIGWTNSGTSSYHSPMGVYAMGTITAKTATDSYAAGITTGFVANSFTYPTYFVGDVVVDATVNGEKAPEWNDKCAMIIISNSTGSGYWNEKLYAAYVPKYTADGTQKQIISHNGTLLTSATHVKAHTEEELKSSSIIAEFEKSNRIGYFTHLKGFNDGLPVLTWQTESNLTNATTYYVDNESMDASFDSVGYANFYINPVDGDAVVTIGNDQKTVSEKGTYTFNIEELDTTINVSGKAFITKDIRNVQVSEALTELSAAPIKVTFYDTQKRDVILALYKDDALIEVVHSKGVEPKVVDGKSMVSAMIDLSGKDVTGCTLKGFLWECDTIMPIEKEIFIGKTMGKTATEDEKAQAVSVVAQSYLDRGENLQYDNSTLNNAGYTRYEFDTAPEAYTSENAGFVNEVSLCYNVYKEALDIELAKTFDELVSDKTIKKAEVGASSFDEAYFEANVKAGDIIAFTSDEEKNPVMIYTGDDTVIYSAGKSYDAETGTDNYESDGAVVSENIANVFDMASDYDTVVILSPINKTAGMALSEKTINRVKRMQGIVAEKTSSHGKIATAELGDEITYTFTIENKNNQETDVTIKDVIPETAELIDGCDNVDGKNLSWKITVGANETATVSYTLKVKENAENYGEIIEGNKALVGGVSVPCNDVKIARTLKEADIKKLQDGMKVMSASEFAGTTLAKWIYVVSFSKTFSISGNPEDLLGQIFVGGSSGSDGNDAGGEEVPESAMNYVNAAVPGMFGGRAVSNNAEKAFGFARATAIDKEKLVAGDVLLAQESVSGTGKIYMYNGNDFYELNYGTTKVEDTNKLLESLMSYDRFIVLRPSISLNTFIHFKDDVELDLTPAQEAIVETAKAYFLRGGIYQYDDSRFTKQTGNEGEYRWQIRKTAPEDATQDEWGYTNCAAFTYDCYWFGLGFDVETWSTDRYHQNSPKSRVAYTFAKTGKETEAEKRAIENEVLNVLQPGDVIVIRRENNTGHAMLYIGNETILHSSGSSFNYSTSSETYEPTIRYRQVRDLFLEGDTAHIFGVVKTLDIIRPINDWKGEIPENTVNRIANMKGIRAEKLSSHTSSMTVNPGDEMTFTFSIYNANESAVTLDINDVVPETVEYVSGADSVNGNKLSWNVTVLPEETLKVSYKVRVKDTAQIDSYVDCSQGKVGGVVVKCPDVKIARTLSSAEQADLVSAISGLKSSSLTGVNLASEIYKNAFGEDALFTDFDGDGTLANTDIANGTFTLIDEANEYYELNKSSDYGKMLATPLYGGRNLYSIRWENIRARLPRENHLIVGDILLEKTNSSIKLFIYDGDNFLDLNNKMAVTNIDKEFGKSLSIYCYAVLRPSLMMQ